MAHPRNCPLLIGFVTSLRKESERPENDDLAPLVEELGELVMLTNSTAQATALRGFRVVEELSRRVLPAALYPRQSVKSAVVGRAFETLGTLQANEESVSTFRYARAYDDASLGAVLERLNGYYKKRKLDNIAMALHPDTNKDIAQMSEGQFKQLDETADACRYVIHTLQRHLRGTQVSWSPAGYNAAQCLCRWLTLDEVVSLGRVLLATTTQDAQPIWNQ